MAEDHVQTGGGRNISGKWVTTFLPNIIAVNLSEFVKQRRVDYANFLRDYSSIFVPGIWQYVAEYVLDE